MCVCEVGGGGGSGAPRWGHDVREVSAGGVHAVLITMVIGAPSTGDPNP